MMTRETRHLIWKEYRAQRGFWIGVLFLFAIPMVSLLMTTWFTGERHGPEQYFGIAAAFPAIYVLGSVALLFAGEYESETIEFLRAMPVPAGRQFQVKIATIACGAILLAAAVGLLAALFTQGRLPSVEVCRAYTLGGLMAVLELGIWALLMAFVTRRTIWTVVGAAMIAGTLALASQILADQSIFRSSSIWTTFYISLIPRTLCVAVALFVIVRRSDSWIGALGAFADLATARAKSPSAWRHPSWVLPRRFRHLVWLEWRQARGVLGFILVSYFVVGTLLFVQGATNRKAIDVAIFQLAVLVVPMSGICGLCVFHHDQLGRRFRFFAEHGIAPRTVWWSRIAVWSCFALSLAAIEVLVFAASVVAAGPERVNPGFWRLLAIVASVGPLSFAVGQFFSLAIPSVAIAIIGGMVAEIVVATWVVWVETVELSHLALVGPLVMGLFIASRFSATDWLLETPWRRRWPRLLALAAFPFCLVFSLAAAMRAWEVPAVTLPGEAEAIRSHVDLEGQRTAEMYHHALIEESDPELAYREFVEASLRPSYWTPPSHSFAPRDNSSTAVPATRRGLVHDMSRLWLPASRFDARALELTRDGRLDEAWECQAARLRFIKQVSENAGLFAASELMSNEPIIFSHLLRAAVDPHQTPGNLRRILKALDEGMFGDWHARGGLARLYWLAEDTIQGRTGEDSWPDFASRLRFLRRFAPWEHERLRRIVAARFLEQWEGEINPLLEKYELTTPTVRMVVGYDQMRGYDDILSTGRLVDLHRSIFRVQLALKIHEMEHGEYPASLNAIVGDTVKSIPLYPSTEGLPEYTTLGYEPAGIGIPLTASGWSSSEKTDVPAGRPFLWLPGPPSFRYARPTSEELWKNVIVYAVP